MIVVSFRKNMKRGLGVGSFIFEAFVPRARSKDSQAMGSRRQIVKKQSVLLHHKWHDKADYPELNAGGVPCLVPDF